MIHFKRALLFFLSIVFLPLALVFILMMNVYGTVLNPNFYDSQIAAVAYSNSANIVFENLKNELPEVKKYMVPVEFEDMFASSFPQDAVLQSWQFFTKQVRDVHFNFTEGFEGLNLDFLFIHEGFKSLSSDIAKTLVKRLPECVDESNSAETASPLVGDQEFCLKPTFSADFYIEQQSKQIENSFVRLVPSSVKILELQPSGNPGFLFNEFQFSRFLLIFGILIFVFLVLLVVLSIGNLKFALVYFGAYSVIISFFIFVVRRLLLVYLPDVFANIAVLKQWQSVLLEVLDKSLQGLNWYLISILVFGVLLMVAGIYCKADRRTSIMA